jgi:hypothetical protein
VRTIKAIFAPRRVRDVLDRQGITDLDAHALRNAARRWPTHLSPLVSVLPYAVKTLLNAAQYRPMSFHRP